MKKNNLFRGTIILALLIFSITSYSQSAYKDYQDGKLYFKISENYKELNESFINGNFKEIRSLFDKYGIQKVFRPFKMVNDVKMQCTYEVHFSNINDIDNIVEDLGEYAFIEYAEKSPLHFAHFTPNDQYYASNQAVYMTRIKADKAWDIAFGNSNVVIAVIDNCIRITHEDISPALWVNTGETPNNGVDDDGNGYIDDINGWDAADNDNNPGPPASTAAWVDSPSHGSHTASTASAKTNNSKGLASVGYGTSLMAIKCGRDTDGALTSGYDGIAYAIAAGANVISCSWGGGGGATGQNLVSSAWNQGITVLASAGNDNDAVLWYPASYSNVISVGATKHNSDAKANFSSYGTAVDMMAPGTSIVGASVTSNTGYMNMQGTSMSCPLLAGVVGLMKSANPGATPDDIEGCLKSTAVNIDAQNPGYIGQLGAGRVDAEAAVLCVQALMTGDPVPNFYGTPLAIIEGSTVTFTDQSSGGGNAITTWQWTFIGGTPASFTGQTPPAITYSTAGAYNVTLDVTNSQSTQTLTKTAYVNVSSPPYGMWVKQNSGFAAVSRGVNFISIVDAQTLWATAYDGVGGANIQEFTKTTNGGNTWTPGTVDVGDAALGISQIHGYDANTAWVAAYPNAAGQTGGIWKTTNGGNSWTRQNSAIYNHADAFTNVVYFWDANTGWCQGDPINGEYEMYTTTDGGNTWVAVPGGNIPAPTTGEFGYTRGFEVVGDNVWFTTNKGRLYHSTDKGVNWTVYTTPIADFAGSLVSFKDATTGLILDGNSLAIYKTTNSGSTWTNILTTGTVNGVGLCYVEGTSTVFTTGATGSSYSQDDGSTWSLIDNEQHTYVDFIDPQIGWSGWFNASATEDGMWLWSTTVTSDNELVTITNDKFNVYPNPAKDQLIIEGLTDNTSFINKEFKIVDVLGKVVMSDKHTNNKQIINISNLNSGLYFLMLDEGKATIKFVKE